MKRLSECDLWQLQEDYYTQAGMAAWDSVVPFYATNNCNIADNYAESVLASLEDMLPQLDPQEPIYLAELAAGTGRFAFLFLKALYQKLSYFPHLQSLRLVYLLTDFAQKNLDFWLEHPSFAGYFKEHRLEVALLAPETSTSIQLQPSGHRIEPGTCKNPLIVIANYYFDTIRQDAFKVSEHKIYQALAEVTRPESEQVDFNEVRLSYEYEPCQTQGYYPEDEFNQILEHYREHHTGSVLIPIGGLRALKNLLQLANGRMILLSSDKSYTTPYRMLMCLQHDFAVHGSFSFMVNYHAIGLWFQQAGGGYYHTSTQSNALETVACSLLPGFPAPNRLRYQFEHRQRYLHLNQSVFTQMEDFAELGLQPMEISRQINHMLSLLRLSQCDVRDFCLVAPKLAPLVGHINYGQECDLLELMEQIEQNFYFFRGERNFPYFLADMYYQLAQYQQSLRVLDYADRCYSEYSDEYWVMRGRNYERLNQWDAAEIAYQKALQQQPLNAQAQAALNRIRSQQPELAPLSALLERATAARSH